MIYVEAFKLLNLRQLNYKKTKIDVAIIGYNFSEITF
jgi:hypothetical protein